MNQHSRIQTAGSDATRLADIREPRGTGAATPDRATGPLDQGSPLMCVPELAAYLQVPEATVYAWRSRGQAPPCYRVGRWLRFRREEVDDWLTGRVD